MMRKIVATFILVAFLLSPSAQADENRALLIGHDDLLARANLEMIEAAQQEIFLGKFMTRDDQFGVTEIALLCDAARRGVNVTYYVDGLHMMIHPAFVHVMQKAGVNVAVFNPFRTWLNKRNVRFRDHGKILVVDGKWLKLGDTNSGNEYVGWPKKHQMQSYDIFVEGEVARKARHYGMQLLQDPWTVAPQIEKRTYEEVLEQKKIVENRAEWSRFFLGFMGITLDAPIVLMHPKTLFFSHEDVVAAEKTLEDARSFYHSWRRGKGWSEERMEWAQAAYKVDDARFLHDPIGKKGQAPGIEMSIYDMIARAKKHLRIYTPYLILTDKLKAALHAAIARGVAIDIYMNSMASSDNKPVQTAYERRVKEIAAMSPNIRIYEFEGPETWHAKLVIADFIQVAVMSMNFDWISELTNRETAVHLISAKMVNDLLSYINTLKSRFTLVAENAQLTPGKQAQLCQRLMSLGPVGQTIETLKYKALEKSL